MHQELFKKMKQAGFIFLMYGLESANDRVLSLIDKGTDQKTEREVLQKKPQSWNLESFIHVLWISYRNS